MEDWFQKLFVNEAKSAIVTKDNSDDDTPCVLTANSDEFGNVTLSITSG